MLRLWLASIVLAAFLASIGTASAAASTAASPLVYRIAPCSNSRRMKNKPSIFQAVNSQMAESIELHYGAVQQCSVRKPFSSRIQP